MPIKHPAQHIGREHGELAHGFYGGLRPSPPDPRDVIQGVSLPVKPVAVSLWRWAPEPTDQQQTSSCTAHMMAHLRAALEARWAEQTRQANPGHRFSELWGYYWARVEDGSFPADQGASMRSAFDAMKQHGAILQEDWAWQQAQIGDSPPNMQPPSAGSYGISGYVRLGGYVGMDLNGSIQARLRANYGVGLAIKVYRRFFELDANGVSPIPQRGETLLGGHGISAFDFQPDNEPAHEGGTYGWLSSWGDSFGPAGRPRLSCAFVRRYCTEAWSAN